MERQGGSGAGSCLGLLAVGVVSIGIIFISYHLHRRLDAELRARAGRGEGGADQDPRRHRRKPRRGAATKKVRFADDVVEPSSNNKEYRRRVESTIISGSSATAAAAGIGGGGGLVSPAPREGDDHAPGALPAAPTHAMRRRVLVRRPPKSDACR